MAAEAAASSQNKIMMRSCLVAVVVVVVSIYRQLVVSFALVAVFFFCYLEAECRINLHIYINTKKQNTFEHTYTLWS